MNAHFGSAGHLLKRLFFSVLPAKKSNASDELLSLLNSIELSLFNAQKRIDKNHSFRNVKKLIASSETTPAPDLLVACALHDVGKIQSRFGLTGRVLATCVASVVGLRRIDAWSRKSPKSLSHRIAVYVRHPEIGANLLMEAQSNRIAIVWARDHHKRLDESTLDPSLFIILSEADRA